jgi:hypothetical protein
LEEPVCSTFCLEDGSVAVYLTTCCHIPDTHNLDAVLHKNLKFHIIKVCPQHIIGVGIAESAQQWALGWLARVRFLVGGRDFYLLHPVQTGSGIHAASYPVDMGGTFPRGKAAVA